MTEPAPASPAGARLARWEVANLLAALLVHGAAVVHLMHWMPWTTDEPFYLQAGLVLRRDLSWDLFHSILHGPLPFWANQIFVPADAGADWQACKFLGRLGMLPFALLLAFMVWRCARHVGPGIAAAALWLHAGNPLVLANAPLMTADVALAALMLVVLDAAWRWLAAGGLRAWLWLGAALGLACATKYLALLLPPAILAAGVLGRQGRRALLCLLTAPVAVVVLHACYLFQAPRYVVREPPPGVVLAPNDPRTGPQSEALRSALRLPLVPSAVGLLPEPFVRGVDFQKLTAEQPNVTHFAGRFASGHRAYYLLGLLLKLPLGWLLLLAAGLLARPRWPPQLGWLLLLLVVVPLGYLSLGSPLQFLRYALPVVPLLAIVAGRGAVALWRRGHAGRCLVLAASLAIAWFHCGNWPRYVPAFNVLAGARPDLWFADGTFDWPGGQLHERDPQALCAAFPAAVRLPPNAGPAFGTLLVYGPELAVQDPRAPDRRHHWLDRFPPARRLGAWYVFELDDAAFAAREATPRDRHERGLAHLAAGDAEAAIRFAGEDRDAPRLREAALRLRNGTLYDEAGAGLLLELGCPQLVARHAGLPVGLRAEAMRRIQDHTGVVALLEPERERRRLTVQEAVGLAFAYEQTGHLEKAPAILDEVEATGTEAALLEQLRARVRARLASRPGLPR